jgi:dTDP-4-dehydrorhamnose reductase
MWPDWAINCAVISSVDACENRGDAVRVNAERPREIAVASASAGARCVHISADSVFSRASGQPALQKNSPRSQLNAYARQKARADDEEALRAKLRELEAYPLEDER